MQPVAQTRGVVKRFSGTLALDDVSFAVVPGSIHALVGRNGAGKSTLVSLLTGMQRPDAGDVWLDGEPAPPIGDRDAWLRRVSCVYQHPAIVPHMSVAENIFLNRYPGTGAIDWRRMFADARALLDEWHLQIDERAEGATLSTEDVQLVEIVRALSFGARFIILDEPTARLEAPAAARLFEHLRALNAAGVTMLFISHHLQEVYDLCDAVTVLRDGKHVLTDAVSAVGHDALIEAMAGSFEQPRHRAPAHRAVGDRVALEARGLRDARIDVTFDVRAGEIVGLAGIGGCGKVSVAETIAGARDVRAGTVRVGARDLRRGSVRDALRAGVGFVPRDRHREGLVLGLSAGENATMTVDDRFGRGGFIAPAARASAARSLMSRLGVVASSPEQPASELSGGNQQKVVFARALARDPNVLVAVDPTAGVDVASKATLLEELDRLRERGIAVLIASDDLDDLRVCDRVLVMVEGRIVRDVPAGWSDGDMLALMEGLSAGG